MLRDFGVLDLLIKHNEITGRARHENGVRHRALAAVYVPQHVVRQCDPRYSFRCEQNTGKSTAVVYVAEQYIVMPHLFVWKVHRNKRSWYFCAHGRH